MAARAYAEVAQLLLERFTVEQYPPGTRLPAERQLADELGVSRPTLREALAALELQGVVSTYLGAGTYVNELPHDLSKGNGFAPTADASPAEVLQARTLIEPGVVRLAAANWDRQTLAAIARPLTQVERAAERGSSTHPTVEDREFHAAIVNATGNAVLVGLLQPMWSMMSGALWKRLKERRWDAPQTALVAREHREIYDAIKRRDADLASFAMEKHIRGVATELFSDSDDGR